MIEAVRISRKIAHHAPLCDEIRDEYKPGPDVHDSDDAAILNWVRNSATTIYHPTGTCKMGPASDPTAVVDARLCVHGIEGLSVADCAIMPEIVSGNTNAPAIMIGEKHSDMVLEDLKRVPA